MDSDEIKEVSIDSQGRLFVYPGTKTFPYIYREALEVAWDSSAKALHSPIPREWSYSRWFQQIVSASKEQGTALVLSVNTYWRNVPSDVKEQIQAAASDSSA